VTRVSLYTRMSSGADGLRSAKQTVGPDQFSGGWTSGFELWLRDS
jgi:hypothetical protein